MNSLPNEAYDFEGKTIRVFNGIVKIDRDRSSFGEVAWTEDEKRIITRFMNVTPELRVLHRRCVSCKTSPAERQRTKCKKCRANDEREGNRERKKRFREKQALAKTIVYVKDRPIPYAYKYNNPGRFTEAFRRDMQE